MFSKCIIYVLAKQISKHYDILVHHLRLIVKFNHQVLYLGRVFTEARSKEGTQNIFGTVGSCSVNYVIVYGWHTYLKVCIEKQN